MLTRSNYPGKILAVKLQRFSCQRFPMAAVMRCPTTRQLLVIASGLATMIDALGGFLQRNLLVASAVAVVPFKWLVARICGNSNASESSILSAPEDLAYVFFGTLLGDLSISGGSLRRHFGYSSHVSLDIGIVLFSNALMIVVLHAIAGWANEHLKSFRAAEAIQDEQIEPMLPFDSEDDSDAHYVLMVRMHHFALIALWWGLQVILVMRLLFWVAKAISSS